MRSTPKRVVLIASDSWFGSTAYGIAQGFRKLDWDVLEINTIRYMPDYSSRALRAVRRLIKPLAVREYNDEIIRTATLLKPNLFLTIKGSYIQPHTLQSLAALDIPTANYYPDARFFHGVVDESTFSIYNHFFTTKSFQLAYLQGILGPEKASFLPHGYVSDVHKPDLGSLAAQTYSCDLLHIGTYNRNKEEWLVNVKKLFPTAQLMIYGRGWMENTASADLKTSIVGQAIYGSAYAGAIQSAKINLAIHMGPAENSPWQDLVSTRTFEIPACKGFMLHVDNHEIRALFEPEEEIGVFSDLASLSNRIEHYLSNEHHRATCIENAYHRCVPAYSYDERAKAIIDWFEKTNH